MGPGRPRRGDGDPNTYWESANNAFPQWLQVDLGTAAAVNRVVLKLPASWGARNQTLTLQGSTNGSSYVTLASGTYAFGPTATITFTAQSARYVRLTVSANTGWPAAQCSEFEVYAQTGGADSPPSAPGNLTSPSHTATSVALAWTASTDDHGVSNYDVRQNGSVVATVSGTSATVSGLNPSTTYSYSVVARDTVGQLSPSSNTISVTTNAAPNTNLARGKPTAESSHTQSYGSGNVVDGDANTYWESANNAFPQWVQVDLGAATAIGRIVLTLPPASSWGARTQTLSVQGSANGSTFSTIVGSAGYTFNPSSGNSVTITFTSTSTRYVRLNFTGNTGWPAGQLSEFEIYQS
jgi:chitodextrinase